MLVVVDAEIDAERQRLTVGEDDWEVLAVKLREAVAHAEPDGDAVGLLL